MVVATAPNLVKPTGRGKYVITKNSDNEFACSLYNFDINGSIVKEDHKQILKASVIDFLSAGGSATIVGLASVTGTSERDLELSQERADNVVKYLRDLSMFASNPDFTGPLRIRSVIGRGRQWALLYSRGENEFWRAVWVHVWDRATPPSDSQVDFGVQLPDLPESSTMSDIGKVLDVASWIISAAATAEIIPVLDMAASILTTLFSLVATWAEADQNAYVNGYIQGYDMAMVDMADPYGSPSLHAKPLSQWPTVAKPSPHEELWASQPSILQQKWHEGEQAGCDAAYKQVQDWERDPLYVDLPGGYNRQQALSGREILRLLSLQHPDNVGVYFVEQFNTGLLKRGKPRWPTRL
jgi:hypothetical protein